MGERLWEVAEGLTGVRVDLLGEEADIVGVPQQAVEGVPRAADILAPCPAFDRPEAADAEGALAGRQAIVHRGRVASDQGTTAELVVDMGAGGSHPGMGAIDVAIEGQQEQAGIDIVAIEQTSVAPDPLVEATDLDNKSDGIPLDAEAVDIEIESVRLREGDQAVKRNPAEYLGMGVVEEAGTPFPDPLIRLAPPLADGPAETVDEADRGAVEPATMGGKPGGGVDDFAVDVELELPARIV